MMPSQDDDRARTKDRRLSTGETHQALRRLLPPDGCALTIPPAQHVEQAQLEAAVLRGVSGMGGLSPHPCGIIRLRPEQNQLTIQLLNAPYVIWHWTERLLPRSNGDTSGDPRDRITGIPGLRYRPEGRDVCLYRPGMPTHIVLTGFFPRWWDRMVQRMNVDYERLLQHHPDWTPVESAAYRAETSSSFLPAQLLSPLLRRIRATAGPGPINSTSTWSTGGDLHFEVTDGPTCPDLIRLVGADPTGIGWTVHRKRCTCLCDHNHDSCTITFTSPATGIFIYYSNARWGRTATEAHAQRIAEMNATALA